MGSRAVSRKGGDVPVALGIQDFQLAVNGGECGAASKGKDIFQVKEEMLHVKV